MELILVELRYNSTPYNELKTATKRTLLDDVCTQFQLKFLPFTSAMNACGGIGINIIEDEGVRFKIHIDWKDTPIELKTRMERIMLATPPLGYKPLQ